MHFNQAHKDETMDALMLLEFVVAVVAADTVVVVVDMAVVAVDIDQTEPRCYRTHDKSVEL